LNDSAATLSGHTNKVNMLAFNHTADSVLASAALDNTVKIWDLTKASNVYTVAGAGE